MVRVTIAAPDNRKTVMVADEKSCKEILEENNVNFSRASVILDGMMLNPEQLRKSLADMGVTDNCTIAVCVKLDNA